MKGSQPKSKNLKNIVDFEKKNEKKIEANYINI